MTGKSKWLSVTVLAVMSLLPAGAALGDATSVAVTVGPNADKGLGYGTFEGPKILTLTIQPQDGYKIASSECTDNAGENLWYPSSKSNDAHVWKTFGVQPQFVMDGESHAAKFHGTLAPMAATQPTTAPSGPSGPSAPIVFDVKVSDIDIDVDALGRRGKITVEGEDKYIWPPADPITEWTLSELEDTIETGAGGGMAMPITDPGDSLPTTRPAYSGKALKVRVNAKKGAGWLAFSGTGDALSVYRQSGGQQTKVTEAIFVNASFLDEVFYIHTCTMFVLSGPIVLEGQFTGEQQAKDTVRIYLGADGYQLFVNTPATTDDYVPVEACGRVPLTVTREPSTAAVDLKLKDNDATNAVQFYDAVTGGTGVAEKTFTMAAGTSSKTYWVSGATAGLGERTLKLLEQNGGNWGEKKSLDVTVVKIVLVVNPDANALYQNLIPIASSQGPGSTRNTPEGHKDNSGAFYIPMKVTLEGPASARNVQLRATGVRFAQDDAGSTPYPENGASVTPGEEGITVRLIGVSPSVSADAGTPIMADIVDVQLCKKKAVVFGITSASFRGSNHQGQALTDGTSAKFSTEHPYMEDKVGLFIYHVQEVQTSQIHNQCEASFPVGPSDGIPNVIWDIKRENSARYWRNGKQTEIDGANGWALDDSNNDDEDLNRMLQIDGPGTTGLAWQEGSTLSHKFKGREWVEVRIGTEWYPVSPYLYWRSVLHAKYKDATDKWVRDANKTNEIVEGTLSGFAGGWNEN